MEKNLILAGVGGQGILTVARAISIVALRRGMYLKQAEVHGMSQRGGAVQSHLRIADHELSSDLIPFGQANLILAVEPLESLRYVQYLREDGALIASTNPVVNIDNYPAIEQVLEQIARYPQHVLFDADRLARAAGSARAANIVIVGAAALFLDFEPRELEDAVAEMFAGKGPKVVDVNRRAFRFGRNAAAAYLDGLNRGGSSRAVRQWIETLPVEQLGAQTPPVATALDIVVTGDELSSPETIGVENILVDAYEEGRRQLYEHEVYKLVEVIGAISPPKYLFVPRTGAITPELLEQFPGEQVVLKVVSPEIVHKTEAQAVLFVRKEYEIVKREIDRLITQFRDAAEVAGVLVVEFVEEAEAGFGNELFVGIRTTREYGPVIAAGLGGVDTEYLAQKMLPGLAVAKAVATNTTAEQFFELFKKTAAYELLTGKTRGHRRVVSDGELLRCFYAFISMARRFCVDRGAEGPDVAELEVNPFAFRQQRMVPLDGRGRLQTAVKEPPPRPLKKVRRMIEPRSIAVLGVSSTSMNFGRIILNNVKRCGFPREHLYVIKENEQEVDEVRCVPSLAALPQPVDLLVMAAPAAQLPRMIEEISASGKVQSAILIPGGVGETEGTEDLQAQARAAVLAARQRPDGGPVFLGPNCMGVQSRPGRYDTFFIPRNKLDNRWSARARRCALISQSGAFIITRLSNLETLDPVIAASIGNQIDLTIADFVQVVGERDDVDAIGVYVEGFNDADGLALLKAIGRITAAGKVVVFYKAGRTESGRSAAAGHTASIAGDYDVCQAAMANAGAIVVDTFKEFEQLMELATALHGKRFTGRRIGALSNAGYETVGMADAIRGSRYEVTMPELSDKWRKRLVATLKQHGLDGLVNPRNPLDLTPMATDQAHEDCIRVMLECDEVDAVVASAVPLSPAMLTTAKEIEKPGSMVERLPKLFAKSSKPLVYVIDAGPAYDALARAIRAAGVPVFRSCDQTIRSLGRYLCHRAPAEREPNRTVNDTAAVTDVPANMPSAETPVPEPA
ncbi:MAG TPA: indolepyruvate oxidoreductase subunit beta [Phycisphaerae bacterium]|nr:indolepyruvate oxidoreductase subunit beta [Phycisphaerae bacterium]